MAGVVDHATGVFDSLGAFARETLSV
jgi:hypothetical protein